MTDATNNAVDILIEERDRLNQAIEILQHGQAAPKARRKAATSSAAPGAKAVKKRRRRQMSAEARQAVSERMKNYWAQRRKEKAAKK